MKKQLSLTTLSALTLLMIPVATHAATFDGNQDVNSSTATVSITEDTKSLPRIMAAPDISFGSFSNSQAINSTAEKITDNLKVVNADPNYNWTVKLDVSSFVNNENSDNSLADVSLKAAAGTVTFENTNGKKTPVSSALTNSDATTTILRSTQGATGTATHNLAAEDVTLSIPQWSPAGNYTAQLTWTLANAPYSSSDDRKAQ
ncbi:WxL domain-containing protein [Lactiplantibacillus daowaiensis]|uniref:WxL domain-containing protein n=1 Tax=Lactiplantibacillus daowaiensis TaxID=2559918 RepID=A0ABW1S1C0_9LACO|nr:WxL domain-containing protein [Lactiplantibacillus daowaiensis]